MICKQNPAKFFLTLELWKAFANMFLKSELWMESMLLGKHFRGLQAQLSNMKMQLKR